MERTQYLQQHRSCLWRRFLVALGCLYLSGLSAGANAQVADQVKAAAVDAVVTRDLALGHVPGAVIMIGAGDRVLYRAAFGQKSVEPSPSPMAPDDIFDIASLTKVVATTTAIMQLVQAGRIDLDQPVATYWPAFAANGKAGVTIRQLLTHTSGLAPDVDAATQLRDAPAILAAIADAHPATPPGSAFVYSDENFIVLGALVGRLSGEPLDVYARDHIFEPLRMADTAFNPPDAWRARLVPTAFEHGKLLSGTVEDPTAAHMDGVAGHAGVFSTADDLARFARMLLQ